MPFTDSLVELTQYVFDKLTLVKNELEVVDIFYGDQDRIPRSPTLCVEPINLRRELAGATRRTNNIFLIYVLSYHSEVRSPQSNRKDSDKLAEAVATVLHADPTMGTRVAHSYVIETVSGYQVKSNQMFRANRLTLEARNITQLPPSP